MRPWHTLRQSTVSKEQPWAAPKPLLGWQDEQVVHMQGVRQAPAHQALLLRLQQAHEVVPAPERGLGVQQAGGLGAGDW